MSTQAPCVCGSKRNNMKLGGQGDWDDLGGGGGGNICSIYKYIYI